MFIDSYNAGQEAALEKVSGKKIQALGKWVDKSYLNSAAFGAAVGAPTGAAVDFVASKAMDKERYKKFKDNQTIKNPWLAGAAGGSIGGPLGRMMSR